MRRSAAVVGEDTRPRGGGPGVARAPVCWVDVAVTPTTRHQARLHAVCVTPTIITLRTPHSHPDHSLSTRSRQYWHGHVCGPVHHLGL